MCFQHYFSGYKLYQSLKQRSILSILIYTKICYHNEGYPRPRWPNLDPLQCMGVA